MEHNIIANLMNSELIEKSQIDFMKSYDKEQILKSICAFLNSGGGWIVVGCDEEKEFSAIPNIQTSLSELQNAIEELISPLPLIDSRIESYLKLEVILINIIKGYRTPYTYNNHFYIKVERKTQLAKIDDISLLLRSATEFTSTWERQITVEANLDDLNISEVKNTMEKANSLTKKLPQNDMRYESFLKYFQLLDGNNIKNGGVVLYGKKPSDFLPQCLIRISVMDKGKTGNEYKDIRLFRDNLFEAYLKIQDYFRQNISVKSQFNDDNWERIDSPQYPFDALDEAMVNAMVHRDYGDMGGEITINIYPNKIEIINSGEMPANVISGKNKILEHNAILRNPILAHMFFLRGHMEKIGRGLHLIKESFVEKRLKAPEWKSLHGYTTLTLFGVPDVIVVNERMVSFLRSLKIDSFTRDDFEEFFNNTDKKISERTARNDIDKLINGGWIKKIGEGPSTRYVRTNNALPDIAG